jgi:hypothetical protein
MQLGEQQVIIGASAENIFNGTAPPQLVQQIIAARLQSELRHAPPKGLSQQAITRDWSLLQQTMVQARNEQVSLNTDGTMGFTKYPNLDQRNFLSAGTAPEPDRIGADGP